MSQPIVLPADVYDTLEFSALAYGGVGDGKWYEDMANTESTPYCPLGHLCASGAAPADDRMPLSAYGLSFLVNDRVFRGRRWTGQRVAFADWCRAMNVARGD